MKKPRLILLLPLCLTAHLVQGQDAPTPAAESHLHYFIKEIGRFQPEAINRGGDMVGNFTAQHKWWDGRPAGFVFPSDSTETLRLTRNASVAYDINDDGVVVGAENSRATLWSPQVGDDENFVAFHLPLPLSDERTKSEALALNNEQAVVGYDCIAGNEHPVLWRDANYTRLPLPEGLPEETTTGRAEDINEAGDIVGTLVDKDGLTIAVLWQQDERFNRYQAIRLPPDIYNGSIAAKAINDNSTIIGHCLPESFGLWDEFFLGCTWQENTMKTLTSYTTPGTIPHGINNEMMVVGEIQSTTPAQGQAFVTYQGFLYELVALTDETKWELWTAYDINDARFIIGIGRSPAKIRSTFLAIPDCNRNGKSDLEDIASGELDDEDDNDIPDSCEVS